MEFPQAQLKRREQAKKTPSKTNYSSAAVAIANSRMKNQKSGSQYNVQKNNVGGKLY